jgi:predicted RNA polymerase sigma factor
VVVRGALGGEPASRERIILFAAIAGLYDALRALSPSPVVEVNRALAVAMCEGALAGLDEGEASAK